jgi:hypothetical protein
MKPLILAGIVSVVLALACYTMAFAAERRVRRVTGAVLGLLVLGVLLDLASAVCMVEGARGSLLTPHGIVGFSALGIMLVLLIVAARHRRRRGEEEVPAGLHAFFRIAYAVWVLAFLSGVAMVAAQGAAARRAALAVF